MLETSDGLCEVALAVSQTLASTMTGCAAAHGGDANSWSLFLCRYGQYTTRLVFPGTYELIMVRFIWCIWCFLCQVSKHNAVQSNCTCHTVHHISMSIATHQHGIARFVQIQLENDMPPVKYVLKCTVIIWWASQQMRETQRERERERGELKVLKTGTQHDHQNPASSMNSLTVATGIPTCTLIFWHAQRYFHRRARCPPKGWATNPPNTTSWAVPVGSFHCNWTVHFRIRSLRHTAHGGILAVECDGTLSAKLSDIYHWYIENIYNYKVLGKFRVQDKAVSVWISVRAMKNTPIRSHHTS